MANDNFLLKYKDWINTGVFILACSAVLYLNQNYVTKDEFRNELDKISLKLESLNTKMSSIDTKIEINQTKVTIMQDHEARIRILEAHVARDTKPSPSS